VVRPAEEAEMNEEEIQAALLARRAEGWDLPKIQAYEQRLRAPDPHRFANPATPAMTDTGEPILPAAPRQEGLDERLAGLIGAAAQGASFGVNRLLSPTSARVQDAYARAHPKEAFTAELAGGLGVGGLAGAGRTLLEKAGVIGARRLPAVAETMGRLPRLWQGVKQAFIPSAVAGVARTSDEEGIHPVKAAAATVLGTALGGALNVPRFGGTPAAEHVAHAATRGGTNMPLALEATKDFTPELVRHTPAIYSMGPEEAAVINRTIRTKAGLHIGRDIENKLGSLEDLSSEIGKRFDKFLPETIEPAQISPELKSILGSSDDEIAQSVAKTAWERIPAGRRPPKAMFSPKTMEALQGRMQALQARAEAGDGQAAQDLLTVSKALEGQGSRPPTTEFLWRYAQALGDRMKAKPEEMGVLKDLRAQVLNDLEQNVPGGKALIKQFSQARNVIEDTGPKISARWNDIRKRWEVGAHTNPQPAPLVDVRAATEAAALSTGAPKALGISILRKLTGGQRADATATRALLSTGRRAKDLLEQVAKLTTKHPPGSPYPALTPGIVNPLLTAQPDQQ
jgi:hypothetical protein